MKQRAKSLLESTLGLALLLAATRSLPAQTPTPQATLAQSVADLQKTPTDSALREKIIKLALEMKPAPAVPEEAKAAMASGTALFTAAKVPEDFKKAAAEFEKATLKAPWLAEAYYNLASAQEKAGLGAEAAENLRLYLLAAPKAADAKAVGAHLSGLQQGLLKQFLADLQKTPANDALREKIIRLARVMNPLPAAPEEVAMHEGAAEYAFQHAKTPADFSDAAKEYEKALLIAPWLAANCFNCGVAYEQAGNPPEAIRTFSLYLLAAPEAKDVNDVRKRIGGLKYAAEKAAEETRVASLKKAEAEKVDAARPEPPPPLAKFRGVWQPLDWKGNVMPPVFLVVSEAPGQGWRVIAQDNDAEVREVNDYKLLVRTQSWGGQVLNYYSMSLTGADTARLHFWQEGQGIDPNDQNFDMRRTSQ